MNIAPRMGAMRCRCNSALVQIGGGAILHGCISVGAIPLGCNYVGAILCGCNSFRVQFCLGGILFGWNSAGAIPLGAIPCGCNSLGAIILGAITCGCNSLVRKSQACKNILLCYRLMEGSYGPSNSAYISRKMHRE